MRINILLLYLKFQKKLEKVDKKYSYAIII
jgi:hypothetical protein